MGKICITCLSVPCLLRKSFAESCGGWLKPATSTIQFVSLPWNWRKIDERLHRRPACRAARHRVVRGFWLDRGVVFHATFKEEDSPMMNPIFGGISGARLPVAEYDLGEGAVLRATYAHVMSPFLMAFSPAEPGRPHPPPWNAVSGGLSHDVH